MKRLTSLERRGQPSILAIGFSLIGVIGPADYSTGHPHSNGLIPLWNALIRCAFIIIWLLSALKTATERERELARVDYLAGAMNSRLF